MGRKIVSGHAQKTGRLLIDTSEFCIEEIKFKEIAEEEETTNSCSSGFSEYEYGNKHVEGSLSATWDISQNPMDTPPNIRAGTEHTMKSFIHSVPVTQSSGVPSGPYFECDNVKFSDIEWSVPAKGKVTFAANFKTSGPYTMPTGGDSSSGG